MPDTKIIDNFSEEFKFLSNFYPCHIEFDGLIYQSVEHAYVASKTLELEKRKPVLSMTAGQAKRYGRTLDLRDDWDDIKLSLMESFIRQKFNQEPLRSKLLLTEDFELIEGNSWGDTFWGVCDGIGLNHLGELLMKIRNEI